MQNPNDSLLEAIEAQEDEQTYLRLRKVILWLSESCARAVELRSDLAPVLSGALQHAVAKLLLEGKADDLIALEVWLAEEARTPSTRIYQPPSPAREVATTQLAA